MIKVEVPATHEIQQAAGGGHHQVDHGGVQAVELLLVIHAADQGSHLQVGIPGQVFRVLGYLHHELAGRGDDQCPRFTDEALALDRVAQQVVENGDQKGRGLAGAGLGLADGVVALQGMRHDRSLDRRAILEAQVRDGTHQFIAQAQVVKAGAALQRIDRELVQRPGRRVRLCLAPTPAAFVALIVALIVAPIAIMAGR